MTARSPIRIPFDTGARACHDRLVDTPVLGDGVERMIEAARSDHPFDHRFLEIQTTRRAVVEAYRALPEAEQDILEENDFVCVADDVLEAIFTAEIERIGEEVPAADRPKEFDSLSELLKSLRLNPSWNDYARPRILDRLRAARGE